MLGFEAVASFLCPRRLARRCKEHCQFDVAAAEKSLGLFHMKQRNGCRQFRQQQQRSRRDFLRVGSLAIGGLTLGEFFRIRSAQAAQKFYESKENTAKSVIQIICQGGIAAQESWNPKPESPLEYRGPFGVVKTPLSGVVLSDKMAECAKIADRMCVVRSVMGGTAGSRPCDVPYDFRATTEPSDSASECGSSRQSRIWLPRRFARLHLDSRWRFSWQRGDGIS